VTDETSEALSSLLSSATLVFAGSAVASVSKLAERIVVGRLLSLEAYGEVTLGLAVLSLASIVSLVGLTQGVPRFMSRFDDEASTRGVWLTGLAVGGGLSLVTAALLYVFADPVARLLFDGVESVRLLRLFVVATPLVVGLKVGVGGIRGMENTVYKTYVADLFYPFVRIGLIVALLSAGAGIYAVGYAYVVAAAAAFVGAHLLLDRLLPLVGRVRTYPREMLLFSLPLVVSTVLAVLLTRTDTLMIGYFRPSTQVALYEAAYPLANGMLVVLASFGFLYLPLASRFDAAGQREQLDAVYKLTTKWIYVVTFPAFLTFLVFPGDVLALFFRDEFARGGLALSILSVGFFTNAAGGRNRETLSALGYTKLILAGNAVAFGANVTLNVLLIPAYGFVGAAVASATSYASLNVFIYLVLRRRFDISPFSRWSVRTFLALPATLIPAAALLSRWLDITVVTLPVFLVASGVAAIVVAALAGGLQPEDEIALEFVEDLVGVRVPFVRRYLGESTESVA